ncbi:MAG: Asd/ArgC dimerization domain-containing protein [Pasteurellaceae bacterium]|nr:Asd/ArgC dimerization domain-containing protein [Pasteurellaceae bacterium]
MNSLRVAIAAEFDLCEKMIEFLQQSELEITQLIAVEISPFAEEQSLRFNQKFVEQCKVDEVEWSEWDYLLVSTDNQQQDVLLQIANAGCRVLDLNGVCADSAPIVLPSVNGEVANYLYDSNIICLPNPQVSQIALTLSDILAEHQIAKLTISSLLPASYQGEKNVKELAGQTARLLNGLPLDEGKTRLAFDVFPVADDTLLQQLSRIFPTLADSEMQIHSIQVPVFYGLAQQVSLFAQQQDIDSTILSEQWTQRAWLSVDENVTTPVSNGEQENGEDNVQLHISEIKPIYDLDGNTGVSFWTVADEQRFSLAFLGVQLLNTLYALGF